MTDEQAKQANLWCPFWGAIGPGPSHMSCDVTLTDPATSALRGNDTPPVPFVCKCECTTCKRAWWAAGRPGAVRTKSLSIANSTV